MPYSKRFRVFESNDSASVQIASDLAILIRERAILGRRAVLGLVAGRVPLPLYQELIYLHREEGLSFQNVVAFCVAEYHGLAEGHPENFRSSLQRSLFDHIDILPDNVRCLSGTIGVEECPDHCGDYEREIADVGGIDFLILDIGSNGHIGFNEPASTADTRTRAVSLLDMTRRDAARTFKGIQNVPTRGLTLGCANILEARRIAVLALRRTPKFGPGAKL
jgi:glucosamine-6-phosphate deaminase